MLLFGAVAVAVGLGLPAQAAAKEERRGADLFSAVERGERTCEELRDEDFVAIGEFAMGRMLGSPRAHEAMDRMMASMMGEGGLQGMHEAMGQRFAGCGRPGFPAAFGGMMGMMGGNPGGGQMIGSGGMMGSVAGRDDDGDNDGAWVAAALIIILVGTAAVAVLLLRSRRHDRGEQDPLAVLDRRLADGSISPEEYRERRTILTGSPP